MEMKINNDLIGYKGVIGRREYILNTIYLSIIVMFIGLPFIILIVRQFSGYPLDKDSLAYVLCHWDYYITYLTSLILSLGLIIRRVRDILGNNSNIVIYLLCCIILIKFLIMSSGVIRSVALALDLILCIILYSMRGKITSKLPEDEVIRFNWGAFWGTWIWGLFNKSYITLFAIPLFFTPFFFLFQLICGIKGNEWAFKNTQALEIKTFHKKQKNQAIFWNVFSLIAILFLSIILLIIPVFMAQKWLSNPENVQKLEKMREDNINNIFERYELSDNENKFYIAPEKWVQVDITNKRILFNSAVNFALTKKYVTFQEQNKNNAKESQITKIYSSYNNEILAECNYDENLYKQIRNFDEAINAAANMYKFKDNPELPTK